MVALPTVPIPGFQAAVKKERFLRDAAWLDANDILCGEIVVPLSMRRMIWLEQAHNGFICPWRWENDDELIGHALALVWFLRPQFRPPSVGETSFIKSWVQATTEHRFRVRVLGRMDPRALVEEVEEFLADAFMDAPTGGNGSNISGASYAAWPAYVFDKFADAGLTHTPDQILDMPIKRLWQHMRVALARCNDVKLSNPSDEIAVEHIAKLNKGKS